MSKYYIGSRDRFRKIYEFSFKYLLAFIIPVAAGLTMLSDQATTVVYGKAFLSSGSALRILIWAEVFVFMGVVNNSILVSANKQKFDPVFTGSSAAVNIILNLLLIPRYSLVGAAIASLISYAVGPVAGYFIPSTAAYSRSMIRYSLKPFVASLAMAFFMYSARSHVWASIFVAPLIYLSAMYLLQGFDAEDLGLLRSLLAKDSEEGAVLRQPLLTASGMMGNEKNITKKDLDAIFEACLPYLLPLKLDVSLTTACNTACAYCWQQKKTGSRLTFEAVSGVIDTMCAIKAPRMHLTGGEPTLWPDLERLLVYARKAGIKDILLCTNGYRLQDHEFAQKLVASGVTSVNVSVDTFNPEKFKKLRGYDFSEFERILSSCILLKEKYPSTCVTLISVMSKAVTPEELYEVKKFCDAHHFEYFVQSFSSTSYPHINRQFSLSKEEREAYRQRLFWLKGKLGEVVKRRFNPLIDGKAMINCYKGITTVKLLSDGAVSFCWNTKPVGNILQDSFIDIWTSERAGEVRRYIRDKKCDCHFDCDIYESLELHDYV